MRPAAPLVTYAGLKVWDARGKLLPARFEPAGQGSGLSLAVEEVGAQYPLTIDPIAQQAYLKASNTGAGDLFGRSVAVSGDTVVVGALREDSNATGVNGDQQRTRLRVRGGVRLCANRGRVEPAGILEGFEHRRWGYFRLVSRGVGRHGGGGGAERRQQRDGRERRPANEQRRRFRGGVRLCASRGRVEPAGISEGFEHRAVRPLRRLGQRVGGHGGGGGVGGGQQRDTGVNGDQQRTTPPTAGAAYVFVRNGGVWSQQAYLKASNTGAGDDFGSSVGVSGDTVVVGADLEDSNATGVNGDQTNNSRCQSGAAYVFVRSRGRVEPAGIFEGLEYRALATNSVGRSACRADTVVVGAPAMQDGTGNNGAAQAGAAYVFVRTGGVWSQQAYLKASNTGALDSFGWSVGVSGDVVVVGAPDEDSNATGVNGDQQRTTAPPTPGRRTYLCEAGACGARRHI